MNAIKLKSIQNSMASSKKIKRGQFKFSRHILRFHTLNKDSFSPFANIESFSVPASSLKRHDTQNITLSFDNKTRGDCTQSDTNLFTPTCR